MIKSYRQKSDKLRDKLKANRKIYHAYYIAPVFCLVSGFSIMINSNNKLFILLAMIVFGLIIAGSLHVYVIVKNIIIKSKSAQRGDAPESPSAAR
jgi:hypothetical protein